jgi:putative ABC transport system permease protein
VPLSRVRTLDGVVRGATAEPRMQASLLGLFAALALFLAAIGVYGVVSYLVGQRTQEIAIRLALGAAQKVVLGAMLWEGLRPVGLGLGSGLLAALATTRLLRGMLFEISPADVPTYAAVVAILTAIAGAAVWIPARRAAQVDPMVALRAE